MQIVIEMPDEIYDKGFFNDEEFNIYHALLNGTPLPKGHGRIADIEAILDEMKATRTYDIPFILDRVKPNIEADKEKNNI